MNRRAFLGKMTAGVLTALGVGTVEELATAALPKSREIKSALILYGVGDKDWPRKEYVGKEEFGKLTGPGGWLLVCNHSHKAKVTVTNGTEEVVLQPGDRVEIVIGE